jgi:hypothetical protein
MLFSSHSVVSLFFAAVVLRNIWVPSRKLLSLTWQRRWHMVWLDGTGGPCLYEWSLSLVMLFFVASLT